MGSFKLCQKLETLVTAHVGVSPAFLSTFIGSRVAGQLRRIWWGEGPALCGAAVGSFQGPPDVTSWSRQVTNLGSAHSRDAWWTAVFVPSPNNGHDKSISQDRSAMVPVYWPLLTLFFFPRECSRIFGEDGLTLKLFLKRTAPFSILWTLTNYLYLLALKKLTATDVSALFCCNKAFVFLLSWIVLKDRFMGVRVMAHSIPCAVPPCFLNLITALLFRGVSLKLSPLILSTNWNVKMCVRKAQQWQHREGRKGCFCWGVSWLQQ